MRKLQLAVAISAIALTGCQNLGLTKFKRSYVSVAEVQPRSEGDAQPGTRRTIGSIFVWSNDVNAAVIYNTGVICAQRAMAVLTADARASGRLSEAALRLARATEEGTAGSAELMSLSASIQETAQLLTTSTERTAFLDVGMFYMCQLANNQAISQEQAAALTNLLIVSASGLSGGAQEEAARQVERAPSSPQVALPAPRDAEPPRPVLASEDD